MSILNLASDGLPSIVLTLAKIVGQAKAISRDDLISIAVPGKEMDASRARQTLTRWTSLGLFTEDGEKVRLTVEQTRGESGDSLLERVPSICRALALGLEHSQPLWPTDGSVSEDATGRTADLCRGLSWCLAQDIYAMPRTYPEIEGLVGAQVQTGRFIFLNDTRWGGLRSWARFLGFATGDDSGFLFDPTLAIRAELKEVIAQKEMLSASDFIDRLATRLPVLDSGVYRLEVQQTLRPETWIAPDSGHLSTSLSFALRRLQKQGMINLLTLADAGSNRTLVGQGGRIWDSFTHVELVKDAS